MKNINFYKYETARICIKWNNIIQPYGYFKTAIDAFNIINNLNETAAEKRKYTICTPNGEITLNN